MFKKLLAFLAFLLAAGSGLSLYLPEFHPAGATSGNAVKLVSSSFKTPVSLDSFLVCGNDTAEQWGVQAGMFTDLAVARQLFDSTCADAGTQIFKVMDRMGQPWYLATLGPFPTEDAVDSALVALRQSCRIQGLQIRWPLPKKS